MVERKTQQVCKNRNIKHEIRGKNSLLIAMEFSLSFNHSTHKYSISFYHLFLIKKSNSFVDICINFSNVILSVKRTGANFTALLSTRFYANGGEAYFTGTVSLSTAKGTLTSEEKSA